MKSVGNKIKGFASKTIKALPKVVNTGKKIINAVKPAIQFIPGVSNVVNAVDTGLGMADSLVGKPIGKSLMDQIDYK